MALLGVRVEKFDAHVEILAILSNSLYGEPSARRARRRDRRNSDQVRPQSDPGSVKFRISGIPGRNGRGARL
jgi:hypothetical protein